jgi:hypothetical protein
MTITTVSVSVPVDPATAFTAFTDELDLWWVRGPTNYYDAARAVAMTCEPGVGGRLLEVYDEASGDARELGRITVWEPGARLAWTSSVDDVASGIASIFPVLGSMRARPSPPFGSGETIQSAPNAAAIRSPSVR